MTGIFLIGWATNPMYKFLNENRGYRNKTFTILLFQNSFYIK